MLSWPCGMAKCDENIHDKVTFQLAAVDLNSSTLMVRNLCDRHRILIVGCAYYANIMRQVGLNRGQRLCQEWEKNMVNVFHVSYSFGSNPLQCHYFFNTQFN